MRYLMLLLLLLVLPAVAEEDPPPTPGTPLRFVVIQVFAHPTAVPVSSENRQEKRFYISRLVAVPATIPGYSLPKKADAFFEAQVVPLLKKQGITVKYYDSDVQINGGAVYALNTEADAKECRDKALESCRQRGGNIYEFTWSFEGNTLPEIKQIHRDPNEPHYDEKASSKKK